MDSPRPVPLPASFVVKNGSKTRSSTAAGMPLPVSSTIRLGRTVLAADASGSTDVPPARHGVARVHRQVHQHLFELRMIGQHEQLTGLPVDGQLNVLANQPADQHAHLVDDGVRVEHLRTQHLSSG